MEHQRKLIVGYDLCEDYSQVSCFSYKSYEPIPISPSGKEEDAMIPTILGVHKETKLWSYGKDAKECSLAGNGLLVEKLLKKVVAGEEIIILGQSFTGVELLEKFLRKTLTLIKNHFPTERITKLVVTIQEADSRLVDGIYEALHMLGLEKDRAVVMSHAGAYMYYALSQDRSLWINDVGLFDYGDLGLSYYQISTNRRTTPMIAGMVKKDFSDKLNMPNTVAGNSAYMLQNIVDQVLYKQIVSTIYFTGRGFDGEWANEVIKGLCTGRRVFIGQNLYTKGACYAAKELSGDKKLEDIILLNNEMLISSIWIHVFMNGAFKELLLSEAAVYWYEVDKRIEVILEGEAEIELITRNIMSREVIREKLHLENLPKRPDRMTRLELRLTLADRSIMKLKVTDLGFGEQYPETGLVGEFTIDMERNEVCNHG